MRHGVFVLVLIAGLSARVGAQLPRPAGVVLPRSSGAMAATPVPASLVRRPAPTPQAASARGFWRWVGFGALGGAAVGAVVGALATRTDEESFIPPEIMVAGGAVVGAVGGGLIGALAYAGSHSGPRTEREPR
jgi:hypothetical protein